MLKRDLEIKFLSETGLNPDKNLKEFNEWVIDSYLKLVTELENVYNFVEQTTIECGLDSEFIELSGLGDKQIAVFNDGE